MKILIVTPKYYPDTFPINLIAEKLVKEGNEVDVLTTVPFNNKKYDKPKTLENGVTVNRVKTKVRTSSTYSLAKYYLSLYKEFKKWAKLCTKGYDVVYTYSVSPVLALVAGNTLKKKGKTPLHVAHILDIWPEAAVATGYISTKSVSYKTLLAWSKKEYRGVDKFLLGTKEFEGYIKEVIGIKDKKMINLVQPGLVYDDKEAKNPYDTNKTNILYCGNISKFQLVDKIVPLMERINNPNIVFNIVGTGGYLNELKKEIKEKNLSNIVYHGYFDYKESSKYFKNADALFVGIKNKGIVGKTIPNKLVTYLYYAKPIVGTINGELTDLLKENGNLIGEESIDCLVESFNAFLKLDQKQKEEIGKKNRQYYDDNFSIDKFNKKLLSSFSRK